MKVMIWNVNGLRACAEKGFLAWMRKRKPDVLGLQEVRATPDQVPEELLAQKGGHRFWNPAARPGYSGVGLWSKTEPLSLATSLGRPEFDAEGRLQIAEFPDFVFFNTYFPNGKGKDRDNSRVGFKLEFYAALLEAAAAWQRRGKAVLIGGDFNTAHQNHDLENWKTNRKTSGFLPEECAWIDRYLAAGFCDPFREARPGESGHYTWWSQRMGARGRNVGWRIDYFLLSADARARVKKTWHEPEVAGSDHCPVGIELISSSSS